jgi:hypothetical protein
MSSYADIIPLYIQHSDTQWDAFELVNYNYPIENKHWELQDSGFLLLKENSPFDHDYDPWNRRMRAWQFLDTDGHLVECKAWTTQMTSNIAATLYEIRYTTIKGWSIPLWRYADESKYVCVPS